jgi:hypothetical protein|tara:strand:- start:200 stop:856 length:657 start_codon:yes stop_codon:yes gene_type:complete
MAYYNAPDVYLNFMKRSTWKEDYEKPMDPYYLRAPLANVKGDWDHTNLTVPETSYEVIDEDHTSVQQEFTGLKNKDRWDEGLVEDQPVELQKIKDCFPLGERYRFLIHVQKPGQMHVWHVDPVYGNGLWDNDGEEWKQKNLVRFFIMLDDWRPGQMMQFGSEFLRWKRGDVIFFRWQDVPHGTANVGHYNRPLLQLTGETTPEFEEMLKDPTVRQLSI